MEQRTRDWIAASILPPSEIRMGLEWLWKTKGRLSRVKQEHGLVCREIHSHKTLWQVLGGAAVVALVAGVLINFPDIVRYIKISRM